MIRIKNPPTVILFLAILQVLCSTYFLYIPHFFAVNSLLFLISGFGISICLLVTPAIKIEPRAILNKQLLFKLLIIAVLLPLSYQLARHVMDQNPLRIENADMLPIMRTMGQRFWNGQWKQVYQPIPEIWNGIQPIYLPAMWLPFSLSLVFDFDIRWITLCGIWLSVIICVLPAWRKSWLVIAWVIALLALLAWLHTDEDNNVIKFTEEGIVFFYYAVLTVAIILFDPWLLGISIALCLLSRYSFIGWLPFAILFLWATKQYKLLLKTIGAVLFVVVVLLILPFGISPMWYHLHLQQDYISQAKRVWHDNPEFYYHSLGMAKFFGPNHIMLLHFVLIVGTFLIPILFFFLMKKRILATSNMLLAGFQLSISFFYSFLDISYLYLFYTPVVVSLVIAGWTFSSQGMRD